MKKIMFSSASLGTLSICLKEAERAEAKTFAAEIGVLKRASEDQLWARANQDLVYKARQTLVAAGLLRQPASPALGATEPSTAPRGVAAGSNAGGA